MDSILAGLRARTPGAAAALRSLTLAGLALVVAALPLAAQAPELGRQSLRPYWHVFAAYALVIILVAAWAVSIGRRLRDVERRLVD